jgi:predicted dehydrogenase
MSGDSMGKVRLGVVGLGSVFEPYSALIRELIFEDRLEVTMVCDTEPNRAPRVQDFLRIDVPFTTDYREVITSDAVDAVLILTAMPVHGKIAHEALEAGKHVLVEKPMSVDLAEAAELVELAANSDQLLVCAPHVVLSPTYQALWKRCVDENEVGTVLNARARYGWSGPDWGRWYYETGGGPLFDLGVYNITSLTGLMGPVQQVTAVAGTAIPERVVEGETITVENFDNYQILLDFGDARFAVVTTGFTMQDYRSPAIELYGINGTAQLLGDDWAPQGYEIIRNDKAGWTVYGEADPTWPWTAGLRHMVDCLLDGEQLLIQPQHAYHCLEVMVKAQVAASSGVAQAIDSTFDGIPYRTDDIYVQRGGKVGHDIRIRRHRED